ncbi:uncharacterized protein LOC128728317 [Anopheles nili]|uniref:uncharacterized protein LOC128728317 n=1 Tax=Anopheles nili TaxID=185578 RepID=UPI00237AFCD2|nr:uncharacterized protein LOC128728317 [Anopheles nili]
MGDLFALLHDITNIVVEMEFCEDFNKLQLILNNTNQYVRSFDKIVFDSGNEPYIIEIVARLLKYLRIQNYLDGDNKVNKQYEKKLRRITMYMLLNTDVCFRYDLEQDSRVNHLLNSLPQLTKCLLFNCIWGLDLDRFLYEMLRYAPLWFSMQFLDQAIVSLKYAKPYEVLERVESMVCAIYFAICRTDCDWRKIDRNRFVDQQRTLGRMFDFIAEMLSFFNTQDIAKFEGWSKLRKHRYVGFVLKHMFSMTMACLDMYFRKPAITVDPDMAVYELMDDRHVSKPAMRQYSQATDTALLKINHWLLNTLETCLKPVTVFCLCYWTEIDLFKEGEETLTLNQVIGESAYRLYEELKSHKHFRHSITHHLPQFAQRPKTLADKAAKMPLGMLLMRIDGAQSEDERLVYLNEFVSRAGLVFDNAECLDTIKQHMRQLRGDHVRSMIEFDTREPIDDDNESMDDDEISDVRIKLRELIMGCVDVLPPKDFFNIFTFAVETFGLDFCHFQQPDMIPSMIQLINRLQDTSAQPDADGPPNVQKLLFQAPSVFFSRLIRSLYDTSGRSSQDKYVNTIVSIILEYKSVSKLYLREHLETLLVRDFDICRSLALRRLVQQLYEVQLFEPHEYIEQFVLKGLVEAYTKKERPALYELLTLFGIVYPSYAAIETTDQDAIIKKQQLLKAAVLCLSDIACGMRFTALPDDDDSNIEPGKTKLVTMALQQLVAVLQKLQLIISNEDKQRMLLKIEQEMPRSIQYYFRKHIRMIPLSNEDHESFAAFMYKGELSASSDDMKISAFLLRVYPQCTQTEALSLAQDELLRSHIPKVVESLQCHLPATGNESAYMRSCMSNYIQCLIQVLLPAKFEHDCATETRNGEIRLLVDQLCKILDKAYAKPGDGNEMDEMDTSMDPEQKCDSLDAAMCKK